MGNPDMSLVEFLDSQSKVIPITSERDVEKINKKEDHVIFLGANWCAYSQLGVPRFDKACDDKKKTKCALVDVGDETGVKIVKKLGVEDKVRAFPTTLIWNAKTQEYQISEGMKQLPQMKDLLSPLK